MTIRFLTLPAANPLRPGDECGGRSHAHDEYYESFVLMKALFNRIKSLNTVIDIHVDTRYRIGMRVIKTVVSVVICLIISLFTDDMNSMSMSAITALVTLCATHGETVRSGVLRLLGTIIGGVFGILTVLIGLLLPYYSDGLYVLVIPVMILLNLYSCNLLNMQDTCQISCVVTIIIAANVNLDTSIGGAFIFTLLRLRDTFIGVVVATVMNILPYYIHPLSTIRRRKAP